MFPASLPLLAALIATTSFVVGAATLNAETVADSWSDLVEFRTEDDRYVGPYHATLRPDGMVVLKGWNRPTEVPRPEAGLTDRKPIVFTLDPPRPGTPLPTEIVVTPMNVPLEIPGETQGPWWTIDYINCGGHALTSDGELFTAGGSRVFYNVELDEITHHGLAYATLFDGTDWIRFEDEIPGDGESLANERWYPTVTLLPERRMLVTSGIDLVRLEGDLVRSPNRSVAMFDLDAGSWSLLSEHDDSPPEIWNPDYTHAFVLPNQIFGHDVLMLGDDGVPVYFSSENTPTWRVATKKRPGTQPDESPNNGASSLLLPIRRESGEWGYENGSVLAVGGDFDTSAIAHADVYEPKRREWGARIPLESPRHYPGSVLLPDGRILIITGHTEDGGPGFAEYIDPATGFALTRGTAEASEIRGYHSIALLMPDGRVFVSGGNDGDTGGAEKPNFRYYSPDYVFAPRPRIVASPDTVAYGEVFEITWEPGEVEQEVGEVVLLALGSMTHSIDTGQRYVQLEITGQSGGSVTAQVPPRSSFAPQGYYLLFVLDTNRIPSIGRFVKVM